MNSCSEKMCNSASPAVATSLKHLILASSRLSLLCKEQICQFHRLPGKLSWQLSTYHFGADERGSWQFHESSVSHDFSVNMSPCTLAPCFLGYAHLKAAKHKLAEMPQQDQYIWTITTPFHCCKNVSFAYTGLNKNVLFMEDGKHKYLNCNLVQVYSINVLDTW